MVDGFAVLEDGTTPTVPRRDVPPPKDQVEVDADQALSFERFRGKERAKWDDRSDEPHSSSYTDAEHGPEPIPAWVITEDAATEEELGILKTGKEADVHLVERRLGERVNLLAAKRYRPAEHRQFHRDSSYTEGRRVRRSRETRAMANRTGFGRDLLAGQWALAEFGFLSQLWQAGASVPYPVQLVGTEVMLEFIGDEDGEAAPRLAQIRPDSQAEAEDLFHQTTDVMRVLAGAGYAHADLSPYNILVHEGRVVVIDLPQAVEIVVNPKGFDFLRRDCVNVCTWFSRRGVDQADPDLLFADLTAVALG